MIWSRLSMNVPYASKLCYFHKLGEMVVAHIIQCVEEEKVLYLNIYGNEGLA